MKRKFTKYPKQNIEAATDSRLKFKLINEIRVDTWNGVCEYLENMTFDEIPDINLKGFYRHENSRTNQILRDLDKLSEDVARYFVDTMMDSEEE